MPARRKKVKGNWLFSLFWNSYVTSVYFAIEYGYNSCKHYLWYLSSLIRKCFWIFPSNIAPNATTSYSEIRGWFFAQWNFQVKIHQKLPYFWRFLQSKSMLYYSYNATLLGDFCNKKVCYTTGRICHSFGRFLQSKSLLCELTSTFNP